MRRRSGQQRAPAAASLALLLTTLLPPTWSAHAPLVLTGHAYAAKSPLLQTVGQAEVDWEAGTVTAQGAAAADLRLPGPDAARPAARRAAEKQASARLGEALSDLPVSGTHRLPPPAIAAAVARAKARDLDYQSNGGVVLRLAVDFTDLAAEAEKATTSEQVPAPKAPRRSVPASDKGAVSARPGARVPDLERAPAAAVPGGTHREGIPSGAVVPELLIAVPSMPLELAPRVLVGGVERRLGSAVYRLGEPPRAHKAHPGKRDKSGRLVLTLPTAEAAEVEGAHAIIYVRNVTKR
jgi:hypothetical protein